MTLTSLIVTAFNAEETLTATVEALLAQTYVSFEIIIVDDGSTDNTFRIAQNLAAGARVQVIHQANLGLAGARNTGIAAARGTYVGFCDAGDLWGPGTLARHVAHLKANPQVGVSFSGSARIDEHGQLTGRTQRPRLRNITPEHVLKRHPVRNGSAAVLRRAVLNDVAYCPRQEAERSWYFDETFRHSEDVEFWIRVAITTYWEFEGIPGLMTLSRNTSLDLSGTTDCQLAAWDRIIDKLGALQPGFFTRYSPTARAYRLRYLSRRAISNLDSRSALTLSRAWLNQSMRPLIEEPVRSCITLAAVVSLAVIGPKTTRVLMNLIAYTRTNNVAR